VIYGGLGATLVLAAYAVVSVAGVLVLRSSWPRLRGRTARLPPARRRRTLAALRLLPSALGAFVAVGLVAPAYLAYEPGNAGEAPGLILVLLATFGGALLVASAARIFDSWRATRRLLVEWRSAGQPLDLTGAPAPIFRTESSFPVVAAVGVVRPRLFVATQVLGSLADDERAAVLAHEDAHLKARDNLTGLLLRACPDGFLWGREASVLEMTWREAAEQAADEHAALGAPGRAVSLADALVKVARMVPRGTHLGVPAAALHGGEAVAHRVERLLLLSREGAPRPPAPGRRKGWPLALLAALALAAQPLVLALVHAAIEEVVRFLP
jgi:Peptidase family M48